MLSIFLAIFAVVSFCAIVLFGLFTLVSVMFPPIDYTEILDGDLLGEEE